MTLLRDLQRDLRAALLGEEGTDAVSAVLDDGLTAGSRLDVYRHHVLTTLTAALRGTFPVVCRLVDERFFAYAADHYVRREPPTSPCLAEYGATFPDFLAGFPPCASLPYLADVARLEWAMARALDAADATALLPEDVRRLAPESVGELVFRLDPSVSLLESPWPIDAIWRANQPGAHEHATVDLRAGSVALEVRRLGDDVVFRTLSPAVLAFRRALVDGARLTVAAERALAVDPRLDLAQALTDLVAEGLLVSVSHSPSTEEGQPCPSQP